MSKNSDIDINYAVRPPKAGPGLGLDVETLHVPAPREVSLPEPVNVHMLNGRPPLEWEESFIRASRERERRAEAALLKGCCDAPP